MLEIFLIVCIFVFICYITSRRPKGFPGGPPLWPLFGNMFQADWNHPNPWIKNLHSKYRDFSIIVPFYKVVFLCDTNLINEMLLNDYFTGRPDVCFNRDRFEGKNTGIMFGSGPAWLANKRLMLKNFRNFGMGKGVQETVILHETQTLLDEVKSYGKQPCPIEELFYIVNINITWTLFGGEQFSHSSPNLKVLSRSIRDCAHHFSIIGGVTTLLPFLRHLFPALTGQTTFMKHNKVISHFIKQEIMKHKKTRDPGNPRDLIDAYLDQMETPKEENEDYFTEEALIATCADAMIGGSDTGSATLACAIMFLSIDQSMQEKMVKEIEEHVGFDRLPNSEDRSKLPYCQAVIQETLRLRPPAPIILAHQALKDTRLGKYIIPKGTLVFPHVEVAFLDSNLWDEPNKFNPERFLSSDGKLKSIDAFMPFSRGKRACPGESQARLGLFIILTSLVQKFHFKFPPEQGAPTSTGKQTFLWAPPAFDVICTKR